MAVDVKYPACQLVSVEQVFIVVSVFYSLMYVNIIRRGTQFEHGLLSIALEGVNSPLNVMNTKPKKTARQLESNYRLN